MPVGCAPSPVHVPFPPPGPPPMMVPGPPPKPVAILSAIKQQQHHKNSSNDSTAAGGEKGDSQSTLSGGPVHFSQRSLPFPGSSLLIRPPPENGLPGPFFLPPIPLAPGPVPMPMPMHHPVPPVDNWNARLESTKTNVKTWRMSISQLAGEVRQLARERPGVCDQVVGSFDNLLASLDQVCADMDNVTIGHAGAVCVSRVVERIPACEGPGSETVYFLSSPRPSGVERGRGVEREEGEGDKDGEGDACGSGEEKVRAPPSETISRFPFPPAESSGNN
eukprot:Cvel_25896.t1-p1 / transcript=Cvel_25896.t1 / gene=Cvel_25896 / organism=Chromera_velia_CCMP2878 / gene_product=hypothetical protein / transcript_product=hypothetical protein / location=Cvel_scaffold2991:20578-21407(+) / protein_length=276 / sequence_SO=supercontig / SO=protein_coding / is_pseudo=false